MEQIQLTLKSNETIEYNDKVYDSRVFKLEHYIYNFSIQPKARYWRFGIRLSKTEDIKFLHPNGRYKNPAPQDTLEDVHLGVGDHEKARGWRNPNRLHLAEYYLNPEPEINTCDAYVENSRVEWSIRFDNARNVLVSTHRSEGCSYEAELPVKEGYKYFKVFAWADEVPYEIDCTITVSDIFENQNESSLENNNYWFLKLSPESWRIEDLRTGQNIPFSTYKSVSESPDPVGPTQRPEYELYKKIQKGDKMIGYAYKNYNAVVCLFEVTSPAHVDTGQGEIINITISHLFEPKIPLSLFRDKITFEDELNEFSEIRLIEINKEIYKVILDINPLIKPKTKTDPDIKSRLHSDTFNLDVQDVLNYDLIAKNLFQILKNEETTPPLNIGILAPWGRGKTSLMKRLKQNFDDARKDELSKQERETKKIPKLKTLWQWLKYNKLGVKHDIPYATVWFNPWNYQSSDMIWAGLADAVTTQVVSQIPGNIDQEIFWMQLRLARIDKDEFRKDLQTRAALYFLQFFIWGIIVILATIYFIIQKAAAAFGILGLGSILGIISSIASKIQPYSKTISEAFDKYTKSPKYTEKFGTFHEVQNDLDRVLDLCVDEKKPLIVFVDDLDRCSPSKVVEVIEAINVFINGKYNNRCYFILGMDAEMVAAALDVAYEKMKGKVGIMETQQGSIGWYFLDKFIQLPFFIPVMSETKKKDYLKNLLKEKEKTISDKVVTKEPDIQKVNQVYQKVMSTKDNNQSAKTISDAKLTVKESKSLDEMILQNQIESSKQNEEIQKQVELYAEFISPDPRSLKRFTNLLRFYSSYQFLRMKKNEKCVEVKILAKWLALMVKFPQLVRWIQWDSENKSGISSVAEEKANILDQLVEEFISNQTKSPYDFNVWLETKLEKNQNSKIISELEDMPWLKSRNMFKILMNESSEEAKLKNALDCNVW